MFPVRLKPDTTYRSRTGSLKASGYHAGVATMRVAGDLQVSDTPAGPCLK